jgi:hypothetical protein
MRCENELGQQHEFVTVMLLSDFSRYDGFFNHLGMLSTYIRFFAVSVAISLHLIHYFPLLLHLFSFIVRSGVCGACGCQNDASAVDFIFFI